jgi:predicted Fe-Mo cluster-binding NifX family protein
MCSLPVWELLSMRVAIPVWNGRVSPVFDEASTIVLLDIEDGQEKARAEVKLAAHPLVLKVKYLVEQHVDVLVCGAISQLLAEMCAVAGTSVVSWVAGPLEDVVRAFLTGALPSASYTMPGCCGQRLRAQHRSRRRGNGGGRGAGRRRAGPAGH